MTEAPLGMVGEKVLQQVLTDGGQIDIHGLMLDEEPGRCHLVYRMQGIMLRISDENSMPYDLSHKIDGNPLNMIRIMPYHQGLR
jgi:hypothetical protein